MARPPALPGGQQEELFAHLRDAEAAAESIIVGNEPVETSYVHPGLLELKNAESFLRIGDFTQARLYAEESLRLGPTDPRGHFYGYATVAQILAAQGAPEESLQWAQKAFNVAIGMESWRVTERLRVVLHSLKPHEGLPNVRQFILYAQHDLMAPA